MSPPGTFKFSRVTAMIRSDEAQLVEAESSRIGEDVDFSLSAPDDLDAIDPWNGFEIVLEVLGDLFELDESDLTREAHEQDGNLGQIDVLDTGIVDFLGKLRLGDIDFVSGLLQSRVEIHLGIELHLDDRHAFAAGRTDLLDAGDAFELGLDGSGDERLDVLGTDAAVGRRDQDQRDLDLRKGLQRQREVGPAPATTMIAMRT